MSRFYFDMTFNSESVCDDTGVELANVDVARMEVLKALPEIARDVLIFGGDQHELSANIRDETGRVVYTVQLTLVAGWTA